jgi:transposase-like protein
MENFNGVSLFKFMDRFKTDDDCKEYLFNLKFTKECKCSKCDNDTWYDGIKPFTKVCKKCRHVESCTSNTLFHKVKFGLKKAFCIVYEITTTANGMSALQISRKYDVNYDTAWLFLKKVRISMGSSESFPMTGKVFVDEYVIGGFEKGAVGRKSNSKKIKVVMAVEATDKNRVKRMYNLRIEDYSTKELSKIFDKHISLDARVQTDEWRSYAPLKATYNITMDKSIKNNSPVNRMIQQLKSWIRGTHHSISRHHCETYLNEFSFRINRSQWKDVVFHKCVERMVKADKTSRLQVSQITLMTREQLVERVRLYEFMNAKYIIQNAKVRLVA